MSEVKKIATRESYGNALAELGAEFDNLVVLDADLAAATQATRYLCIRASGTSGWRDEPQLYHRLLPLPQEKNNVTGLPFLVAQISFITNRLNRILSLLHILNATAITISRL
jgi:hypothetical protein